MAFMTHPKHGATNTPDVEEHLKHGWKVSTHEEWLGEKYKRDEKVRLKPGPKPKYRDGAD